ncbi:hypothetical protein COT50_03485 [candidate division WWE3 bacterium CG08_land_8_20_14_0_20_41_10]|uniref:SpoVT-AbrB domain-containing protein n=1 Tax=candidate division WWE3 bacterium CG08_land_8_20_14_0_20_41_10 TaxID=1975085 RepID=A0A2H0XB52_UNCKA|nr:MAG: hypothetical protein COT50_03485 [candidate division WWE3 bacterium CG08_land_8_20_14_0_20_41_10]
MTKVKLLDKNKVGWYKLPMQISKISSKNQITLSKNLLDQLSLGAGDRILINIESNGNIYLRPIHRDPISIIAKRAGIYARTLAKDKKKLSDSQISQVTSQIVAKELANE